MLWLNYSCNIQRKREMPVVPKALTRGVNEYLCPASAGTRTELKPRTSAVKM